MVPHSLFFPTKFSPLTIVAASPSSTFQQSPLTGISTCPLVKHPNAASPLAFSLCSVISHEEASKDDEKEVPKVKWVDVGPIVTDAQKQKISQLSSKMTKRCKALMRRIICFSPEENLSLLLAAWVKVMKPKRADWLSVMKEMRRLENPLLLEVMEYALLEDSFEANVRDYTKLIDAYAKCKMLQNAEKAFQVMKTRGFVCDQVTLTVLVDMYSKAGNLNRANDAFEEIKLLGLPLDKRAYGSMMMAYIRAGIPDLAENLMREMEAKEIYAGKEVYKALLRAYSIAGNSNGAQRVFNATQLAGIVPDSRLCALLVNAYCMAGQNDRARSALENMRSVGLSLNDKCIALMLAAYEKENELEKALSFLADLERDGVVVDQETSQVLACWFQRLGVVKEVELILREIGLQS